MMGANPDFVCDEHEFNFPEGTDDYCVACGMRKVDYEKIVALEQQLEDARNAVGRADAQIGALIDQTVIYSGAWDELQEALATEEE